MIDLAKIIVLLKSVDHNPTLSFSMEDKYFYIRFSWVIEGKWYKYFEKLDLYSHYLDKNLIKLSRLSTLIAHANHFIKTQIK